MMKKNQTVKLEITDVTSEGNGVGHCEGMAVFVPMTAVGDVISAKIVKVNKNYAYGITESIISPSEDRVLSDCNVFSKCGGCTFRHISYDAELKIKDNIVRNAFMRIGGLNPEFENILPCETPDFYRNKVQFPVSEINGKAVCGFYARRSHRVIPCTSCRLQNPVFKNITDDIISFINENKIPAYNEETKKGIIRHIYLRCGHNSGEIMVCIVVKKDISDKLSLMSSILESKYQLIRSVVMNINSDNTNVILGRKTVNISGNSVIYDIMCGNKIEISPASFYQVNTSQAEKLYKIAEDFAELKGSEFLLDLYCGAGTIGLSMACKVKNLIGVEIIPQAVMNAERNAEINSIHNAEFICGDASEIAGRFAEEKISPDVIILDPPRKGCDNKTIESVVKMSPGKIIMISCNPATSARDCKMLNDMGYNVLKVRAVDMFARTGHVECVVLLTKVHN